MTKAYFYYVTVVDEHAFEFVDEDHELEVTGYVYTSKANAFAKFDKLHGGNQAAAVWDERLTELKYYGSVSRAEEMKEWVRRRMIGSGKVDDTVGKKVFYTGGTPELSWYGKHGIVVGPAIDEEWARRWFKPDLRKNGVSVKFSFNKLAENIPREYLSYDCPPDLSTFCHIGEQVPPTTWGEIFGGSPFVALCNDEGTLKTKAVSLGKDGRKEGTQENQPANELWHYTGDGCLRNGTGDYLTACDGKELHFRPRDHDDIGQQWSPNLTSLKFNDFVLKPDYKGGNPKPDISVGLHLLPTPVGEGNEKGTQFHTPWIQWSYSTEQGRPISQPEAINVIYDKEYISSSVKYHGEILHNEVTSNKGPKVIKSSFQFVKSHSESVNEEQKINVNIGMKLGLKLKFEQKSFVLDEKELIHATFKFGFG